MSLAHRTTVTIAILALSLLGACQSTADNSDNLDGIESKRWIVETIDDQDVVDGSRVTMEIKGDRVSGRAGCNSYGGTANIDGANVKFGALFSTKMACFPRGVMEQEQRFLNALQRSAYGRIDAAGRLTLTTDGGGSLVFRAEPLPRP